MKKRLALFLALALAFSLAAPCGAAERFPDLAGHWARPYVLRLAAAGVADGYPDGTYGPGDPVTVGALCKLVLTASRLFPDGGYPAAEGAAGDWSAPYVQGLARAGVLEAGAGLDPAAPATRLEAAKLALRALGVRYEEPEQAMELGKAWGQDDPDYQGLSDLDGLSDRDAFYAVGAAALGLVKGFPDGTFGPDQGLTRATAAAIVCRMVEGVGGAFPDLVAATIGERDYTASQVGYYYGVSRQNFIYRQELYRQFGLIATPCFDPDRAPESQVITEETIAAAQAVGIADLEAGETFRDYFLDQALESLWHDAVLTAAAREEGYVLSDAGRAKVEETFSTYQAAAYMGMDQYLSMTFGVSMTEAGFRARLEESTLAREYEAKLTQDYIDAVTAGAMRAYYEANRAFFDTFDYRVAFVEDEAQAQAMAEAVRAGTAFHQAAAQYVAPAASPMYADPDYGRYRYTGGVLSAYSYGAWLTEALHGPGEVGVVEEAGGNGWYVVQYLDRWLDADARDTVDIRHIYIKAQPDQGAEAPTQAQMDAAKAQAERIRAEFQAGERTPEAFGALARTWSQDEGSSGRGGLYENVSKATGFYAGFQDWCLDPARQPGDLGLVVNEQEGQWGWHLIYFQSWGPPAWERRARQELAVQAMQAWYAGERDANPVVPGEGLELVGRGIRASGGPIL